MRHVGLSRTGCAPTRVSRIFRVSCMCRSPPCERPARMMHATRRAFAHRVRSYTCIVNIPGLVHVQEPTLWATRADDACDTSGFRAQGALLHVYREYSGSRACAGAHPVSDPRG